MIFLLILSVYKHSAPGLKTLEYNLKNIDNCNSQYDTKSISSINAILLLTPFTMEARTDMPEVTEVHEPVPPV